jgi:MoxR-like ATPase
MSDCVELDNELWDQLRGKVGRVREEVGKSVVGQGEVLDFMLAALLCRGHCLIVGVPGLGKTLLVRTFGRVLGLHFNRIQFTPDLMPSDILGSEILQTPETGQRRFEFVRGPIFTHLLLADEINRTPPKTQAALLEAMQEKQVTVAGHSRRLEDPFIVYATQNPIEHEGTYPLPEAQLDRFLFSLEVGYPTMDEEQRIVELTTGSALPEPQAVLSRDEVIELQSVLPQIPLAPHVTDYVLRFVRASRPVDSMADDYVKRYVAWGSGPRGCQALILAARALALLRGETAASVDEVRAAALAALRHRILPNYNATGDGIGPSDIIRHLLEKVAVR